MQKGVFAMKKILIYLSLLLLAIVVVSALGENSVESEKEIDLFMTAWHRAAAVADAKTYFDSLAPGAIFLGTDVRERWEKEAFQKWAAPYFRRPSAWIFCASRRRVYLSTDGITAWFDEDLISQSYWPCRGSGVLEKIGGQWKIRQYNMAFTIPNETTRDIKPLIEAALKKQSTTEK
jgi:hypothetical protein